MGAALPLPNVKLLAPIPRPRKNIFGIGLNYVEHVAESARALDTVEGAAEAADHLLEAADERHRARRRDPS